MFEIVFAIIIAWYFLQSVVFLIGTKKKYPKLPETVFPTASVLVAARNEEKNILSCLESLANLDYPLDKLQIIIIDDKSTDKTGEIIESFIKDKPRFIKLVSHKEIGHLKGKTNALTNALEIAKGEIILTTDADCSVPPTWVRTITSYYTENVVAVNGFTYQEYFNGYSGMQNLDFIYLLTVAAGTINFGKPLSCIGNNMSYRRDAYNEVGGYQNLPFSVTEDFNLLMAIDNLKKYKLIFPLDKNALVKSKPCEDFKTLFHQKKRWGVGGLKVPKFGFFLMGNGWLVHLCMLASPFFWSATVSWLIFFKIVIDFLLLSLVTDSLGIRKSMRYFIQFELYYIIYVLLLPAVVLSNQNVTWKERKY